MRAFGSSRRSRGTACAPGLAIRYTLLQDFTERRTICCALPSSALATKASVHRAEKGVRCYGRALKLAVCTSLLRCFLACSHPVLSAYRVFGYV